MVHLSGLRARSAWAVVVTLVLPAVALTGCNGDATGVDDSAAELAGIYDLRTINGEMPPWYVVNSLVYDDINDEHYNDLRETTAMELTLALDGSFSLDVYARWKTWYFSGEVIDDVALPRSRTVGTWSYAKDSACMANCPLTVSFQYASSMSEAGTALAGELTVVSESEMRVYRKRS